MTRLQVPDASHETELEQELTRIAWRVERWIDPGPAGVVVGAAVAAVAAAFAMPWWGRSSGLQVLTGDAPAGALPQVAVWVAVAALVVSGLALLARFWPLACAAALVCAAGPVTGLWAVWSARTGTVAGADVGPGLVVAVLVAGVLTATWVWIVVSAGPRVPGTPPV
ncbi:hypothetical protein WIS52_27735 [Pseudonocardia nematodicida]|uniref:Transmembrane protein n=1 Tax=Pseudonocardia nematodicida TaxID=1206997 RepID=A0ABV1KIT9_9PSEU